MGELQLVVDSAAADQRLEAEEGLVGVEVQVQVEQGLVGQPVAGRCLLEQVGQDVDLLAS